MSHQWQDIANTKGDKCGRDLIDFQSLRRYCNILDSHIECVCPMHKSAYGICNVSSLVYNCTQIRLSLQLLTCDVFFGVASK